MPVTREHFERGMTYQQYKDQMTRNRERLDQSEQRVEIEPEDLAAFQRLPRPLNVLALAEDWCGDVIANLPVLGRLAEESGKLNVRVLLRDQNLDLMDQYLNKGQFRSIPTFIFLDEGFNEVGVFQERPDSVTELRARLRTGIYERHPEFGSPDKPVTELPDEARERLQIMLQTMRDETTPFANREVIRELRAIAERAA